MTQEIQKSDWKTFFNTLSKEKLGWETNVQIISLETGANMIAEGLPFNGVTYEDNEEGQSIEITTGLSAEDHDSHTIPNPQKVAFQENESGKGGTLDIEDASGTKTLISFLSAGREKSRDVASG